MNSSAPALTPTYRLPSSGWILIGALLLLGIWIFRGSLFNMAQVWLGREEYSHGVLIPVIAAYLLWQHRGAVERLPFAGSWSGFALVLAGLGLRLLGEFAALNSLQQCGFLLVVYGVVVAFAGWRVFRQLAMPLLILWFMIPLPNFLLNNFSSQLQLISSQIGVWFVRLFGISVFIEGNVIDLGSYKLQVAEACDGLRYLFPLMTLGFIMAYLYKASMWKRVALFLSTIPVTILMNSLRIGTIGVMVEHWGVKMAEGFLHEFQGWAVFMASTAVLLLEMVLLARIGSDRRPWREVFGMDLPSSARVTGSADTRQIQRSMPTAVIASAAVMVIFAAGVSALPERVDAVPQRESFYSFPNKIEAWTGKRDVLDQIYLDALLLDDYLIADYIRDGKELVNFHVAWYNSQRAGQGAHSPRMCLPGGGWRITQLDQVEVPGVHIGATPLRANRVKIELGNQKQLVYYWFQQRGRVITNEYLVKWYLFWDSLTRHRTDGALVRLVTPLRTGEQQEEAEARLARFAADVTPQLKRYVAD